MNPEGLFIYNWSYMSYITGGNVINSWIEFLYYAESKPQKLVRNQRKYRVFHKLGPNFRYVNTIDWLGK